MTPLVPELMGAPDRLTEIDHAYRTGRIARMNWAHRQQAVFLDRDGVVLNLVDHFDQAGRRDAGPRHGRGHS